MQDRCDICRQTADVVGCRTADFDQRYPSDTFTMLIFCLPQLKIMQCVGARTVSEPYHEIFGTIFYLFTHQFLNCSPAHTHFNMLNLQNMIQFLFLCSQHDSADQLI